HQLLLFHQRVIVPAGLRSKVLHNLHVQHQGITKTRALARQLYYRPRLMRSISTMIADCSDCQALRPSQIHEPLLQTQSNKPFEAVSIDLLQVKGQHFIVVVDRFSSWTCVAPLKKLDTHSVIKLIENWFLDFGLPEIIRTDGDAYDPINPEEKQKFQNKTMAIEENSRELSGLRSRHLAPLHIGSQVLIQNPHSKRWDTRGTVRAIRPNGRSYDIDVNGKKQLRNRIFLKPYREKSVLF
ncbi:hypothetical protein TCAL_04348, partial [Tigriopus californicus]